MPALAGSVPFVYDEPLLTDDRLPSPPATPPTSLPVPRWARDMFSMQLSPAERLLADARLSIAERQAGLARGLAM